MPSLLPLPRVEDEGEVVTTHLPEEVQGEGLTGRAAGFGRQRGGVGGGCGGGDERTTHERGGEEYGGD